MHFCSFQSSAGILVYPNISFFHQPLKADDRIASEIKPFLPTPKEFVFVVPSIRRCVGEVPTAPSPHPEPI
jgi:hypothetical protein